MTVEVTLLNVVQRTGRSFRNMLLSGLGFAEAGVTGGVVAPAAASFITRLGDARAARLLTDPNFTRWLRKAPNTAKPRAIDAYFDRLRSLASRSPTMATDVQALERVLIDFANDNTARLAAEPGGADNSER